MIKLGLCTFDFGWLPLEEALAFARALGFERVDVGASGPTAQIDQVHAAKEPAAVGAWVRQAAGAQGLELNEFFACRMHPGGENVSTNDPDPAVRRAILRHYRGLCQCAAEAGCDSLMGVPGDIQPDVDPEASWAASAEVLSGMVAIAGEYGIVPNVEPHRGSILETPEAALRMAREVDGLCYTLDYAHFEGQGIAQARVAVLHPHVRHMHAKPARPGWSKGTWHENTIDFAAILADVALQGHDVVISVETIGRYDEALGRPVYQPMPPSGVAATLPPGLLGHPAAQTMVVAYEIEQILSTL